MIDIKQFGKGGLIQKTFLKDYRLETIPTAGSFPSNFEIIYGGKIKNQNGSGSCVSQATAYYAEVLNFKETKQWIDLSPKFLYAQVHQQPFGSYTKDNMSIVCNKGIATEQDLTSYDNGNPPSEEFMIREQDITPQIYDNALTYVAKSYVTWDNMNIESYKQAIMTGSGCVVISWGNNTLWQTANIQLPDVPSQMAWTHGIYLVGWDDNRKAFKFINSWGKEWGENGYGYLPYEYITRGFVFNPYTMIDLPNGVYPFYKKLIALYLNLIALLQGK